MQNPSVMDVCKIETLTQRDADTLLSFLQALDERSVYFFHPHTFDRDSVRRLLASPIAAFKAVVKDDHGKAALAGYGWLGGMETDAPTLGLCVGALWRGQGIGRALIQRLIDEALLRNKPEIRLGVVIENVAAIHLYRSFGFEITPEPCADPTPSHILRLRLPTSTAERVQTIRRRLEGTQISIVPYSHADWAWVHTRHWHERRYALVFEEVLSLLRQNPSFRWYFDNYANQYAAFAAHKPNLIPELRERVRLGQIAICGAYSNVRPHMVGEETFVRNLIIGRRLFGAAFPEADLSVHADCVDVATGHSQLPQILSQAGYRYLRIWRPFAAMSFKGIPTEFVWHGLNGSEILASRGLYGGLWFVEERHNALRSPVDSDWGEVVTAFWDSEMEDRVRCSLGANFWVAYGCDDARPCRLIDDTPFDIVGLVKRWQEQENSTIRFATPLEQFKALDAERSNLPDIEGYLDPCDVAYNAAWNGEKGLAVQRVDNDRLLTQAEAFATLASEYDLPYPEAEFTDLWKEHLLTCAHATQWLYADDFAYIKRLADRVAIRAEQIRDAAMDRLVESADLPADALLVVFNPLAFPQTVPVMLHLSRYSDAWPTVLRDAKGDVLVAQVLDASTGQGGFPEKRVVVQVNLPPLGITVLRETQDANGYEPPLTSADGAAPFSADTPGTLRVMDNGRLHLTFDEFRLVKVTDTVTGRDWEAAEGEWGGLILQDVAVRQGALHVGPITGETACVWSSLVIAEHGPVRWRCRREGHVGNVPVTLDAILHAGNARLEFALSFDWPGYDGFLTTRVPVPEDAHLHGDIPFGVEERDLLDEPYEIDHIVSPNSMERTRKGLFYARSFVSCDSPTGQGFAIVSRNTDRYYLRNHERGYLEHLLLNSVISQDEWEKQVEQSTLTGRGSHQLQWSLLFYAGDWKESHVVREAAALRQLTLARNVRRTASPPSQPALPNAAFVSVEPSNVMLTALYREGEDWIVRIHETEGISANAVVSLPFPIRRAEAVNLIGEPVPDARASFAGYMVSVGLAPWEIRTLRLA